jgi:predicted extracellular nuclease
VHIGAPAAPAVRISQVYGGGGNSGATYKNDFIELFNAGGSSADLTGWSVQYASATGSTWQTTPLSGTIPPGGYYLVQEAQGAGGTVDLPAPDAADNIPMSATSGKIALVTNAAALSGTCPTDATIVDLVGYGSANCSETAPAPGLSNTTAGFRDLDGCEDTDDNSADFSAAGPAPRNSASPPNPCVSDFTLTVSADPVAGGTVAKSPDQATYPFGANVDITATPAPGYLFLNWSGDAAGSANPLTVVMDGSKNIVAHFATSIAPQPIVISQVYGGGGNSGASYKNDFIELFNRGSVPVDVTGWSLQYASTNGTTWFSTTLVGTIQPARYYLVQQAAGSGGTLDLPTPDAVGGVAMSAISGKVALVNNTAFLTGACSTGPMIEDFVGYGPANCAEGTPTADLNNLSAAHRKEGGCVDTGNNLLDFETLGPTPRNSSSPINVCSYWVSVDPGAVVQELSLGIAPNPAQSTTFLDFALPRAADAQLRVYDLQGRVVATIADGHLPAGRQQMAWNGMTANGPARSGIYFVRLQAAGLTLKRTLVLAR